MKRRLTILFLSIATAAIAQTEVTDIDSTYFHPAASMFIQGDSTSASNLVAQGLSSYPENGKLLRLKELLDQQQEQKQNQQNQDQQEQNEQQDKNEQDDNQNQEQNDQDPQDQDQEKQNQDPQDQQDPNEEQKENPQQQPQPRPEQMSEDEAKRLLDAMKQEEENKRLQLHPVLGAPVKVDKDW